MELTFAQNFRSYILITVRVIDLMIHGTKIIGDGTPRSLSHHVSHVTREFPATVAVAVAASSGA